MVIINLFIHSIIVCFFQFNGKRFCYQFIISRKTKAVLSKRNNIPTEIFLDGSKIKNSSKNITNKNNRKRKSSSTDGSNLETKRSSCDTIQNCDHTILNGSEWGSDEDDILSDTDIQNLDQCLADIFIDPQFSSFFSDSSSPLSTSNLSDSGNQSLLTATATTTTTEKEIDDLFIMTRQPSELSVSSTVSNNNYNDNNQQQHELSPFISLFSPVKPMNSSMQTSKHLQKGLTSTTDLIDLNRCIHHYQQQQQQKSLPNLFDTTATMTPKTTVKNSMMIGNPDHFDRRFQPFHESSGIEYSRDLNEQKSRESEAFLQGLFPTHSIHKPSTTGLLRSLPDFSLIDDTAPITSKDENSFGFFTDFLLDENMHSSSIENYFDL